MTTDPRVLQAIVHKHPFPVHWAMTEPIVGWLDHHGWTVWQPALGSHSENFTQAKWVPPGWTAKHHVNEPVLT